MVKLRVKKPAFYAALCLFWTLGMNAPQAQVYSTGVAADPEVLISTHDSNPRVNLEKTLVDIKAVDAPALHSENGKTGIGTETRYGQGIIIDNSGIIATNRHIIQNAKHIYVVISGGRTFEASILKNSRADLCLLKINAPFPLRALVLADSSELQTGENVIAITNAGLNPQRIKDGQVIRIYSGVTTHTVELLEMNIPLKPGDSGGPILNKEGSLLGLIMGKQISDPGKSYAIASSRIQQEYFNYRNSILR